MVNNEYFNRLMDDGCYSQSAPSEFTCRLTGEVMSEPVMTRFGHSYEASAVLEWVSSGNCTCPETGAPLKFSDFVTNRALRARIAHWKNSTLIHGHTNSNESKTEEECDSVLSPQRMMPIVMVSVDDIESECRARYSIWDSAGDHPLEVKPEPKRNEENKDASKKQSIYPAPSSHPTKKSVTVIQKQPLNHRMQFFKIG